MLFQKLLFFVQGYSGAANSNIDADDHENGGIKASFAEDGRDVQFGDVYDRTHPRQPLEKLVLTYIYVFFYRENLHCCDPRLQLKRLLYMSSSLVRFVCGHMY
jgi:hypothetical protein